MENKNLPAFPTLGDVSHNPQWVTEGGLTKREYFAAMALQGIMSKQYVTCEGAAKTAVQAADELLNQLDKQQP